MPASPFTKITIGLAAALFLLVGTIKGYAYWSNRSSASRVLTTPPAGPSAPFDISTASESVIVTNHRDGYRFAAPRYWQLQGGNEELTLLDRPASPDTPYGGVTLSFFTSTHSSPEEFFRQEINRLRDEKISLVSLSPVTLGTTAIERLKADFATSYWPSQGEVIYLYHFSYRNRFLTVVAVAADEATFTERQADVLAIITSILDQGREQTL